VLAPLAALAWALAGLQEPHRPLSVEEMAATSGFAGVARVDRLTVRRDPENGGIYTDVHLSVLETWAGGLPAGATLTQLGGELDGLRSAVAGWNYRVAPGETIVLFAKAWKGPYVVVTGRRLGLGHVDAGGRVVWDMDRGADGSALPDAPRPALDEIRDRVRKAVGRPTPAPAGPVPAPATSPAPAAADPQAPGSPSRPAEPRSPGRQGAIFFTLGALCVLAAIAVRALRRKS
jgi:hypothetical protein